MILFVSEPVSCIAEPSVERQSQLRRRWRSTGPSAGYQRVRRNGLQTDSPSLLVLCFSDSFFVASEVNTKDLCSTFYVLEVMEKRSERFFVTFVSRPVPFTYIPPTGNERGRKPIAMYVIAGHSRRCSPIAGQTCRIEVRALAGSSLHLLPSIQLDLLSVG